MPGQPFVREIRHGIFEQARAIAQRQHLLPHRRVDFVAVVQSRAQGVGGASDLRDGMHQRIDLRIELLRRIDCRSARFRTARRPPECQRDGDEQQQRGDPFDRAAGAFAGWFGDGHFLACCGGVVHVHMLTKSARGCAAFRQCNFPYSRCCASAPQAAWMRSCAAGDTAT